MGGGWKPFFPRKRPINFSWSIHPSHNGIETARMSRSYISIMADSNIKYQVSEGYDDTLDSENPVTTTTVEM